jgi:hypothetical protein
MQAMQHEVPWVNNFFDWVKLWMGTWSLPLSLFPYNLRHAGVLGELLTV